MPFDFEFWRQWEGQRVDSAFPLQRCVSGDAGGAVFETEASSGAAVLRLVSGTQEQVDERNAAWEKSARLSYPALVRILAHGTTVLGDAQCAYVMTERAEEVLAEVLRERFLTPDETRELLGPVLGALRYLESNGFAHGAVRAANIMAFGDQVKISSDGLTAGGSSAADCRAVGTLLREVLGPAGEGTAPFATIIRRCAAAEPWDLAGVEACLRGEPLEKVPVKKRTGLWAAIAAAGAVIVGLLAIGPSRDREATKESAPPAPAVVEVKPPVDTEAARTPKPSPTGRAPSTTRTAPERRVTTLAGISQVMPDIPKAARNTITGRVRIHVRVRVDGTGRVSQATLEPPPASKYFSTRVVAAAQAWRFPAGQPPQDWVLRFELLRDDTRVTVAKIGN